MIGIDIVHIPTFIAEALKAGPNLTQRIFNPEELTDDRPEHLAGWFAAKEAAIKACALTADDWHKIKISNDITGRPVATVGDQPIEISISHHGDYAVAVATRPCHGCQKPVL